MAWLDAHLLSVLVFAPAVTLLALLALHGVAVLLDAPRPGARLWRAATLLSSSGVLFVALRLARAYDPAVPDFQFVEYLPWLPQWGVDYLVGVDGISLALILLTSFLVPVVCVAAWNEDLFRVRSFSLLLLVLESALLGAFVSLNVLVFYGFWELALLPMAFLVGRFGGEGRLHAAVKLLLFGMVGALPFLLAMLVLASLALESGVGVTLNLIAPPGAMAALLEVAVPVDDPLWWKNQAWLFVAFALPFAIQVPLFPLHTWLADAHEEAPTVGSVLLAGLLLKLGIYGFLRFAFPLFPAAAQAFAPVFVALALVGVVGGGLLALVQSDLSKRVGYVSLASLGLAAFGIFALDTISIDGAVLQLVHHGLVTSALFLLVGMLQERRGTRAIAAFGGVARPMPVFAACLGLAVFACVGVPGSSGFVGELLILVGAFISHPVASAIALVGLVPVAAALLWMLRRVLFGPIENPENRGLIDLGLREKLVMAALLVPIVAIGVYPEPWLRRIEPSVVELLRVVEQRSPDAVAGGERWALPRPRTAQR